MDKPQSGVNGWLIALGLPVAALVLAVCVARYFYRPYYIPSESMLPTFEVGDQFLVDTRTGHPARIGDIVIVRFKNGIRIVRVVALGGDRVAMRAGVPVVNGMAARQRGDGTVTFKQFERTITAQRLVEQLAGDNRTHRILDVEQGYGAGDDVAETRVPPGHFFALGDNRDRAADSRFGPETEGLGMAPEADIVGTPALIWAAHDRKRAWTTPNAGPQADRSTVAPLRLRAFAHASGPANRDRSFSLSMLRTTPLRQRARSVPSLVRLCSGVVSGLVIALFRWTPSRTGQSVQPIEI
eukprot:gene29079-38503_t